MVGAGGVALFRRRDGAQQAFALAREARSTTSCRRSTAPPIANEVQGCVVDERTGTEGCKMMKTIDQLGDGIVGIEAHRKVTREDYENVLIPALDRALKAHKKIRFLYHVAPDFSGFTGGALWDDAQVGIRHLGAWERVAVVTDVTWIADAVKAFQFVIPAKTRVFHDAEVQLAKDWLREGS